MIPPEPLPEAEERRVLAASIRQLPDTAAFAREFCMRHALPGQLALRLTLVLEELFTNTVDHGHQGDSAASVVITLRRDADAVHLLYEDEAPPFDPLAAARSAHTVLGLPAEERPIGGLGLPLTLGMALNANYAYEDGRNRLRLAFDAQHRA